MSNEVGKLDFEHLDNPYASNAVYDGVERRVGRAWFKLRPVGDRNRYYLAYKAKHRVDTIAVSESFNHLVPCILQCVLMDWREVTLTDGTEVPYSPANAEALLNAHPGLAYRLFHEGVAIWDELNRAAEEEHEALGKLLNGGRSGESMPISSTASVPLVDESTH